MTKYEDKVHLRSCKKDLAILTSERDVARVERDAAVARWAKFEEWSPEIQKHIVAGRGLAARILLESLLDGDQG